MTKSVTAPEPCRCQLCLALLAAVANAERNQAQQRRRLTLVKGTKRRDAA